MCELLRTYGEVFSPSEIAVQRRKNKLQIREVEPEPDLNNAVLNFLLWRVFYEPAHFIMERKMLLGIKARAEKLARAHEQQEMMAA